MINAKVSFLSNETTADLSRPPFEVQEKLQSIGVLTPPNNISLDNSRMLHVELYAEDSTGENILSLIDRKTDTLGKVNMLCNHIRTMDYRDDRQFTENLSDGAYSTVSEALRAAEKLKETRRIKNKRKEQSR